MALVLYWGSGSPFAWRVMLALEHKRLAYESQLLHFDKQEHQSPQMLKLNPRGRLPVLRDGDYVVFESVAVLYYLERKYPDPPMFGVTAEEAGVIMRVICEFQAYAEPSVARIVSAVFADQVGENIDELTDIAHAMSRGDPKAGAYILEQTQSTYMRTDDALNYFGGPISGGGTMGGAGK